MEFRIRTIEEYHDHYRRSLNESENFWSEIAENFSWMKKWDRIYSGDFVNADFKWFEGAKLNITVNCLDRHLQNHGDRIAYYWEPNNPNEAGIKITYRELHEKVCRLANAMKNAGIKKGDSVCIYLPMIPELVVATLACARIGAMHNIVFGGFSAASISGRVNDASCKMIITADGTFRGDKPLILKNIVDEALQNCLTIEKCIVVKRSGAEIKMKSDRDVWYDDFIKNCSAECAPEMMDAEDALFILYTSGSTGKPKGVVHTTAGYMVWTAYTFANVFQYNENEIFWCTADIGWITGHSYIIYGPLLNGASQVLYEGVPQFPDWGRWWDIVKKYSVNILYTAPTAIRSLQQKGLSFLNNKDLSSLRVLGSVGEPINEEAWEWYFKNIGNEKCPIVDTWWQTETGGILISSLAGITEMRPTYATLPLPGVEPIIMNVDGKEVTTAEAEGNLCMRRSWPGQARTVFKDHERFKQTYFSAYKNLYFTGDGCRRDEDGYYRITGRVDDVIKVSGHRIGTAEVENAINETEGIVESAVVSLPHHIKGEAIIAFVIPEKQPGDESEMKKNILATVEKNIGSFAKPEKIFIVSGLPKTRSGKIMRRILRKLAEGNINEVGDITTLLNPEVVEEIKLKIII
jgi:acetyl-CoA synthetase